MIACDLCQADLTESGDFVLLNRIGLGADGGTCFLQFHGKRSNAYQWDHEARLYSGRAYCFPACLHSYLEAAFVEKRVEERHGR